jgi:hypothetical protein
MGARHLRGRGVCFRLYSALNATAFAVVSGFIVCAAGVRVDLSLFRPHLSANLSVLINVKP